MKRRTVILSAALTAAFPLMVSAQKPSARDAFWSATDLISVTPNPAAAHHTKVHANAAPRGTGSTGSAPTVAPSSGSVSGPQVARVNPAVELASINGYGAAPHLVRSSESRLGLRCSVLLRGAENEYAEVTPGTVFHSGDHIRLSFLANEPGYFYVIQQGSSGAWSPIYPPRNASPDSSKVEAGKLQVVPSGTRSFAFDQQKGDEKLYVILSRTPIEDIDRAIRKLSSGEPTPAPDSADSSQVLEASNQISDAFVQQLASRDLTLVDEEKVDQSAAAGHDAEKAIYVVNKGTDPAGSSQVVLSLDLKHE